jgi:hypothetical protein
VLFFFAGHGIGPDGTNYLIPADVPKLGGGDERLVKSRSMAEIDLTSDSAETIQHQTLTPTAPSPS